MNRRQLPSESFTYISRLPQVCSTGRCQSHFLGEEFGVQRVDIVSEQIGYSTHYAISGKRGKI